MPGNDGLSRLTSGSLQVLYRFFTSGRPRFDQRRQFHDSQVTPGVGDLCLCRGFVSMSYSSFNVNYPNTALEGRWQFWSEDPLLLADGVQKNRWKIFSRNINDIQHQ